MRSRARWSARVVGAALGVLGMSVAGVLPPGPAWPAANDHSSAAASSSFTLVNGSSNSTTSTRAAVKYRWGKVVAGDEFNYKGAPDRKKWRTYNSAGHNGRGLRHPSAWRVNGSTATVTGDSKGMTGGMSSRFGQKYGRWEARMKTNNRDAKYHPNILLWPDVDSSRCPEVNFAQSTADTRRVRFFLHYGCEPRQTRGNRSWI